MEGISVDNIGYLLKDLTRTSTSGDVGYTIADHRFLSNEEDL